MMEMEIEMEIFGIPLFGFSFPLPPAIWLTPSLMEFLGNPTRGQVDNVWANHEHIYIYIYILIYIYI